MSLLKGVILIIEMKKYENSAQIIILGDSGAEDHVLQKTSRSLLRNPNNVLQ